MNKTRDPLHHRMCLNALMGALVGATVAVVEILVRMIFTSEISVSITREYFFPMAMCYAIVWIVGALILTCIVEASIKLLKRRVDKDRKTAFYLSIVLVSSVFVLFGNYVNVHYLPRFWAWQSLIFDAAWAAVCLGLIFSFYRLMQIKHESFVRVRIRLLPLCTFLAGLLAVCFVASALPIQRRAEPPVTAVGEAYPEPARPNVLLIVIDTLRADYLSFYGFDRDTSPYMDKLTTDSILFENAIAQSSWTPPSTASILTSVWPSSHGHVSSYTRIAEANILLAEVLSDAGYSTAIFSDNILVSPEFGFGQGTQYFFLTNAPFLSPNLTLGGILNKLAQKNEGTHNLKNCMQRMEFAFRLDKAYHHKRSRSDVLNREFLKWLDAGNTRPFFAHIHYMDPHDPYDPPEPYLSVFTDPAYDGLAMKTWPYHKEMFEPFLTAPQPLAGQLQNMIDRYCGEILSVDRYVHELLEELKQRRLYENTLVIITSDHGEEFYEHKGYGHGQSLYSELVKIPLIVRMPHGVFGGRRVSSLVQHLDIAPTILDVCSLSLPESMKGSSLRSLFANDQESNKDSYVYSELTGSSGQKTQSLMNGEYKLIQATDGLNTVVQVFNISEDPHETLDLSKKQWRKATFMLDKLKQLQRLAAVNARQAPQAVLSEETKMKLKSLGYVR